MGTNDVQIVKVNPGHSYELNIGALEHLLKRADVRDLPVAVVSVAGAYRGGKSFLLNFFVRYLKATEAARKDGSWIGANGVPLQGFGWRGGSERNTTGIMMWSEPIIVTKPGGQKVCVLLVDTQGTFDTSSTVRDNSTIFALSTLVASVQVYNLFQNIKEDDLQHLQLFTEYGKMLKKEDGKAFQEMTFLVRDWSNPFEHPYGYTGGNNLLKKRLMIKPEQPAELRDLRAHIQGCFEQINCFLMAHPGLDIVNPQFNGDVAQLSPDFKEGLKQLIPPILDPAKIKVKTMNGQPVRAAELFTYIKTYLEIFNSNDLPTPTTILKATSIASLQTALDEGIAKYLAGSQRARNGQLAMSTPALNNLHQAALNAARHAFTQKRKIGTPAEVNQYLEKLNQFCAGQLTQLTATNASKVRAAADAAVARYDAVVNGVTGGNPCLYPRDMDQLHNAAVAAALQVYDSKREKINGDAERDQFNQSFGNKYNALRASNEQSNQQAIAQLLTDYQNRMMGPTSVHPPLSNEVFLQRHQESVWALQQALRARRNRQGPPDGDFYMDQLNQKLNAHFNMLNTQNHGRLEAERLRLEQEERHRQEVERLRREQEEAQRQREEALRQAAAEAERRRLAEEEAARQREQQRHHKKKKKCAVM